MIFKRNILHKLIAYLVVISVLPLLLLAVSVYDVVEGTLSDLTTRYSLQLLETHRDYLELQMEQVQNLATRLASIEDIGDVAARADTDEKRNAYDELATQAKIRETLNIYGSSKGIVSIDLFTAQGHRFYVGDTMTLPQVNEATRIALFEKGLASSRRILWLGVENNLNTASASHKVLTALKIIWHFSPEKKSAIPVAMLLINYSTDYLFDYFSRVDLGQDATLMVLDANGRMIFTPDRTQIGQLAPAALRKLPIPEKGSSLSRLDLQRNLFMSTSLHAEPWQVIGMVPKSTLLAPMQRLTLIALLLILLAAVVIAIATRQFRRNIIAPVQAISEGFRRLQPHADQPNSVPAVEHLPVPESEDEISELVSWFNAFLDSQTMRVQYEKDMEASRHKFASVFEHAPMPLTLVRKSGEFVDVNESWLRQFGYQREDIIGNTALGIGLWVDPSERAIMVAQANQTGIIHRMETQFRTKDGKVLICALSGRPLNINDQDLYILTPVDITRQRQAEREILEINAQLESRVLSRTIRLEEANRELNAALDTLSLAQGELVRAEKMAALGSLVAGIAHEINTPVGVIVTGASVLNEASNEVAKNVEQGLIRKSDILHYLHTATESSRLILANAERAANLIQSFKQVAVDQTSEQRREFEIHQFIEGLITSLTPTLRKAHASIVLRGTDAVEMDSYPGLLAQVLTNLTMNAVTHGFAGRSEGHIVIDVQVQGELVIIQFDDDGIGIPEANLEKIFDPFFTTKRGQGGTGLGLNIVFNIVTEQLGGTITVHSAAEQGAHFRMVIPRVTKQLREAP